MWYEQCLQEPEIKNCRYDGPPQLVTQEAGMAILRDRCPHLINESNLQKTTKNLIFLKTFKFIDGEAYTCCDLTQMTSMDANIQMAAGLLLRCPSCYRNLLQQICAFSCAPNQQDFMRVVDERPLPGSEFCFTWTHVHCFANKNCQPDKSAVYEVDVFLSGKYMNATYNACKEVIMPSTGQLALDASCGIWGAKQCTPQR